MFERSFFRNPAWSLGLAALMISCASGEDGGEAGGGGGGAPPIPPVDPPVHPPVAQPGGPPEAGIAKLNTYRETADLAPVGVDPGLSAGCAAHLDYLIWQSQNGGGPCFLSHTEDNHENPFYSPENEQAGKSSVLACGVGPGSAKQSLEEAVDGWMNTLYHRLPLLNNGLHTIGAATKDGWNCIRYLEGTEAVQWPTPILWPPADMIDVPRRFEGREVPCPTLPNDPTASTGADCPTSGFIVTMSWFNWGGPRLSIFAGTPPTLVRLINESTETEIPLLTWYADRVPGHDPAVGLHWDTVALVPFGPLPVESSVRVEFQGAVRQEPTSLVWRFTTGSRDL